MRPGHPPKYIAAPRTKLDDPEWLATQYWSEGLSTSQIAKIAGCSHSTVQRHMKKFQIPLRPVRICSLRNLVVRGARS